MGKVSVDDELRIQTIREQWLKYRAIAAKYPDKNWKLDIIKRWMATELNWLWPLDYNVWGALLERYKTFQPKPNNMDELKKVSQTIWNDLPQNSIKMPYWALSKDFELVWKLGVDTLNTSSNKLWQHEMSNFHVSFAFHTGTIMQIVIFIVIVLRGSVVA